jgi:hypothetical protein
MTRFSRNKKLTSRRSGILIFKLFIHKNILTLAVDTPFFLFFLRFPLARKSFSFFSIVYPIFFTIHIWITRLAVERRTGKAVVGAE